MNLWVDPAGLRDYMGTTQTRARYGDALLGSNIRAAQGFLERETSRQFDVQTATIKRFTTNGKALVAIPDLRSVSTLTMQGTLLDADETFWLLPDPRHSGVYVNVQVRAFGSDYRANPDWFDRNLDHPRYRSDHGLPNDLVITGDWGWVDKPDELLIGVKALAAWLTKSADAALAGAMQNADGSILDYSNWPPEAQEARRIFKRGTQAEAV